MPQAPKIFMNDDMVRYAVKIGWLNSTGNVNPMLATFTAPEEAKDAATAPELRLTLAELAAGPSRTPEQQAEFERLAQGGLPRPTPPIVTPTPPTTKPVPEPEPKPLPKHKDDDDDKDDTGGTGRPPRVAHR